MSMWNFTKKLDMCSCQIIPSLVNLKCSLRMRKKKVDLVFYSARKGARGLRKNASIFILWMGDAPLRAKNVFRSCFALTRSVMLYYICLFWF